jgi:uncharacterized membrane protein
MKWLYIALAVLGALIPVGWVYLDHLYLAVPGAVIDLGLLLFSFGLALLFIPVGVVGGIAIAGLFHFGWYWSRRFSR